MWGEKYIQILLSILVVLLGTIILSFKTSGVLLKLEILFLLFLMFLSLIILFGLYIEEYWAFTLSFLMFALMLANVLLLKYMIKGHLILFGITFLVGIIGFLISIANIGKEEDYEEYAEPITQEIQETPEVEVYEQKEKLAEKPKKTTAKKKTNKKKTKKKSKKK